ncbi:MAG: DUF2497 domain-containing protein [Devosia sp.]
MDDLLGSIRKIIAEDGKEAPDHAPYHAAAPYGADEDMTTERAEGGLSNRLEQTIMDAFREEFDGAPGSQRHPHTPSDGAPQGASEHAMRDIAEAIHAERAAQSEADPHAFADAHLADDHEETVVPWTPVVLSEPDLDGEPIATAPERAHAHEKPPSQEPVREARAQPLPQQAPSKTERTADLNAQEPPQKPRRRKEMFRSAFSATPPTQPTPRQAPTHTAAQRTAARTSSHDATETPTDREPHLHLIKPHRRTADMTEIAQEDPTMAVEREGNVFRRQPPHRGEPSEETLTSTRTRQNVTTSLDELSRTILTSNPRTLEDLVRDMIRPLLREWLDNNLSDIVERQVRQEIERVSARGR